MAVFDINGIKDAVSPIRELCGWSDEKPDISGDLLEYINLGSIPV